MFKLTLVLAPLLAASSVHALIRFPCSQLVTERLDPLVTPGQVAPHLHQIVGGNAFNVTMDPALDLPTLATCTTCRFVEDKSNYWTAVMYFKHRNGSYLRVPQMANHNTGPGFQDGGMTVYYFQPTPGVQLTAFPPGFRMRVGFPNLRSNTLGADSIAARAVTLRCFHAGEGYGPGAPGYGVDDTFSFPPGPCSAGIRSNIYFPQCWDGVNLDTEDHESHVIHPSAFFGARCPASHPVHVPLLFMEIVWNTIPFNDPEMWPDDGSQPFLFSMGDPTGFGQHADYVFGWEGDSLQRAMDVCTGGDGIPTNCPELTVQDMDSMNACKQHAKVPEIVEGQYIERLPGCNPIQAGPDPATAIAPAECTDAPWTTAAPLPTVPPAIVIPPWTVCYDGPGPGSDPLVPHCDSIPPKTTVSVGEAGMGAVETGVPVVRREPWVRSPGW